MKVQSKDFKDKNKKGNSWEKIEQKFNLPAGEAGAEHKNCVRSLSNQKPMFSPVLELTTTSLHDKQKK